MRYVRRSQARWQGPSMVPPPMGPVTVLRPHFPAQRSRESLPSLAMASSIALQLPPVSALPAVLIQPWPTPQLDVPDSAIRQRWWQLRGRRIFTMRLKEPQESVPGVFTSVRLPGDGSGVVVSRRGVDGISCSAQCVHVAVACRCWDLD